MLNVAEEADLVQQNMKEQAREAIDQEELEELKEIEDEKLELKCISCEEVFGDVKFEEVIYLEQCCHTVCKKCLTERIEGDFPEVTCPDEECNRPLFEFEMENIVGKDKLEELQKKMVSEVLNKEKGVIYCKCGNAIEFIAGKIYYDLKKEDGSAMTKTAAKHMSQHRMRCNECGVNFCKSCKTDPYHAGFTCAQFKKNKEQKKCKFC